MLLLCKCDALLQCAGSRPLRALIAQASRFYIHHYAHASHFYPRQTAPHSEKHLKIIHHHCFTPSKHRNPNSYAEMFSVSPITLVVTACTLLVNVSALPLKLQTRRIDDTGKFGLKWAFTLVCIFTVVPTLGVLYYRFYGGNRKAKKVERGHHHAWYEGRV
jgi:hypothetical protein